jgi:hypothetical protein
MRALASLSFQGKQFRTTSLLNEQRPIVLLGRFNAIVHSLALVVCASLTVGTLEACAQNSISTPPVAGARPAADRHGGKHGTARL